MNNLFTDLTWWEVGLLFIYTIYTFIRAWTYFSYGIKSTLIDNGKSIKLYHILWSVIDVPSIVLGRVYHVIKFLFSVDIYKFKAKK